MTEMMNLITKPLNPEPDYMGVIKVPTSFNIDVEFEIPEFYRRLIALLIDMLIQFFYYKIAEQIYSSFQETAILKKIHG